MSKGTVHHHAAVRLLVPLVALFALCSCFGVSADISVRGDGSGKLVLEYRVSRMAEALGRLDGNSRRQTVPVGRADFERSLSRLPGLRLVSFSSAEDAGGDTVNRAELEFKSIEALPAFFDAAGSRAAFVRENGTNRLSLTLLDAPGAAALDPDLLTLVREVSAGYRLRLGLSAAGTASLATTPSVVPAADIVARGKTVSFSIGTGELLGLSEGLQLEFVW